MVITDEIKELFDLVRLRIGGGIRSVQILDESLCALLTYVIKYYGREIQKFITESQWMSIYGKNSMMNTTDLMYALTTRTMDFAVDFSQYFSKEVGLQQRGTKYELKKDFFKVEKGQQCYVIPAGREINKVMYCTPPTTRAALYGNFGVDTGFGMGISQMGNMGMINGLGSFFFGNIFDIALTASALKYSNSMLRGDLVYKVTAGPDGTHIVHLMSTPGSKNSFQGTAIDDTWGWNRYAGCYVWYTYYDVRGMSDDEITECRLQKSGVIISPDTVPFDKMEYEYLNEPSKSYVQQLLVAEAMITVGLVRGYASGKVSIAKAEMQLDYAMLIDLGKQEKQEALDDLRKYLERLLPYNMLKNQSDMVDSLVNVLNKTPLGMWYI